MHMKTSSSNALSLWVLPGLIAGVVFLIIALIAGALATSVWAMPIAIARVIGTAAPAGYSFALVPVLVGVAVHLAFAIGLGAIFTAFVLWRRLHGWQLVVAALIFVTIETATAIWVVMHPLLPATTFSFYLGAVPLWGSVLGHYMYALTLALLLARNPLIAAWKPQQPDARLGVRE
jgi:hypothetical protein